MINITFRKPNFECGERLESLEVEVATDEEFKDIVASSNEKLDRDDTLLIYRTFDIETIPNKKYYVRARYILNPGGIQGWSAPIEIIADNIEEEYVRVVPPIVLPNPTVRIVTSEPLSSPHKWFKLKIDIPDYYNEYLKSTTWLIEDLNGNISFFSVDDTTNILEMMVDNFLLPDTVYVAKAMLKSVTGNTTEFGHCLFRTAGYTDDFKVIDVTRVKENDEEVLIIKTNIPDDWVETEVEIHNEDGMTDHFTITDDTIDVTDRIDDDTTFIRIREVDEKGDKSDWIYIYIQKDYWEPSLGSLPYPLTKEVIPLGSFAYSLRDVSMPIGALEYPFITEIKKLLSLEYELD
jgi:hypothetical protein